MDYDFVFMVGVVIGFLMGIVSATYLLLWRRDEDR